MQTHATPNARDAKPSFWIFEGRSVLVFMGGFFVSITAFRALTVLGWDLVPNALASGIPVLGSVAFVLLLVNGKSPSHPLDFLAWTAFRLWTHLFLKGWVHAAPRLWHQPPATPHPSTFN